MIVASAAALVSRQPAPRRPAAHGAPDRRALFARRRRNGSSSHRGAFEAFAKHANGTLESCRRQMPYNLAGSDGSMCPEPERESPQAPIGDGHSNPERPAPCLSFDVPEPGRAWATTGGVSRQAPWGHNIHGDMAP
ncbi:hypothetical protein ACCO45_001687 [Purpureocillium lilacinum]|uniref:Uncharacterized protein n=1 Tax=Purpureocillium lilacinum TaxID=33203 RepID=A0ACC4E8Z7_PURLI